MPRNRVPLDVLRPQLIEWLSNGLKQAEIIHLLRSEHGINIAKTTLGIRLRELGLVVATVRTASDELKSRIEELFRQGIKHSEMTKILQFEGYFITQQVVAALCRSMGIYHRLDGAEA